MPPRELPLTGGEASRRTRGITRRSAKPPSPFTPDFFDSIGQKQTWCRRARDVPLSPQERTL